MKLNDMEESLYQIKNSISKNLMEDALRSYSVGILRGGVVFTYLATIEHIKQNCISIRDICDSDLKTWIDNVFLNPDKYVPESNIPDFLHCSDRQLINEQQKNFLKDLIFKRNKCVHSDYEFKLTAEDVRYLYNNAIELFLKNNAIFGRAAIKQFLAFITSSDNIFLNKSLEQCEAVVKDNLKLNLDFINSVVLFYNEIIKCYEENNREILRNNLEKIIYLSCKENPNLFFYFMKSSINDIAKNDIGISIVLIYNILLRVNPKLFIEHACEYDKDNFLRLLPDILSICSSLESENGKLVDILLENDVYNLSIDFLNVLIRFKLGIEKSYSVFDFIYEFLNDMTFQTINRYIPKYLDSLGCIALIFSDEECYKVYLRFLKNNIFLEKENVMHMVSNPCKYDSIREKALKFLAKNNSIKFDEILFSSRSYSYDAKTFCNPKESEINIWNEMIIDNELLKFICDKSINYPLRSKKNAIIENLDKLKSSTNYEDKKSLLLTFLEEETEQ